MALIKEKILNNGVKISYWKCDMISLDKGREEVCFSFLGYVNGEVSKNYPQEFLDCITVVDFVEEDKKELFRKYFRDNGKQYKDIDTACYEYAKEYVEFFKGSMDDI